jgi:hypothetical protein
MGLNRTTWYAQVPTHPEQLPGPPSLPDIERTSAMRASFATDFTRSFRMALLRCISTVTSVIESSLATLRTASSIPAPCRSEDNPRRPGGMAGLSLLSRADRGLSQPTRRLSDGACDLLQGLQTRVFVAGCGPSLGESVGDDVVEFRRNARKINRLFTSTTATARQIVSGGFRGAKHLELESLPGLPDS